MAEAMLSLYYLTNSKDWNSLCFSLNGKEVGHAKSKLKKTNYATG
jgi:hypothetical protein